MTTSLRRGATRALLAVALAAAPLTIASAAHAGDATPPVTGTYKGAGVGYNYVIDGHSAGTDILTIAGHDVEVFCVQYAVPAASSGQFTAATRKDAGIANLDKIADIATRHKSIGKPLSDPKAENVAAQLAIWKYSDKLDFSKVPNADIVARASALVDAANPVGAAPVGFSMRVEASVKGATSNTASASVTDTAGAPVKGAHVTFTVDGKSVSATTDAAGVASATLETPAKAVDAVASVDAKLAAGTVMVPAAGKQKTITTSAVTLDPVKASFRTVPVAVNAGPTPTPAPSVSSTPTPKPTKAAATPRPTKTPAAAKPHKPSGDEQPTQLPHTGGVGTLGLFVALAALTSGALVARHRLRARR